MTFDHGCNRLALSALVLATLVTGARESPAAATAGGASSDVRRLTTRAMSPALADGRRYAAWEEASGRTRIVDTRTSRSFRVRPPDGYRLIANGGGYLLWAASQRPVMASLLFDISQRRQFVPAGYRAYLERSRDQLLRDGHQVYWTGVGRHGLSAVIGDGRTFGRLQLDWRSGRTAGHLRTARELVDLDAPSLARRLCRPLEAGRYPAGVGFGDAQAPLFAPFVFAHPFGAGYVGRAARRLVLQRCGDDRATTLDRMSPTCPDRRLSACGGGLQSGAGLVSWIRSTPVRRGGVAVAYRFVVKALRVRDRRPYRWGPLESAATGPSASHTRERVFISTERPGSTSGRVTIRSARLP